ncbi:SDR family oxidoreductase [Phaeacidiphilus oryzae]|uniref:SDR family oxidoreductase n=1 Tax=Phaeacidiphilus oryzae TaxID=348818 RepID=UPI00056D0C86
MARRDAAQPTADGTEAATARSSAEEGQTAATVLGERSETSRYTGAWAPPRSRRVGRPQDVADAVSFLAGPRGSWITGQVIHSTGGQH